jgi:DNA mismatch repair protein MutS
MTEPGRGLVEREVQRVITKGTIVEPGMLDAKRNNYLMAVTFSGRGHLAGIAYCDITTGEFAATQLSGDDHHELERRAGEELSRLQPSELIHVDWQPAESSLHALMASLKPLLSTVEAWQVEPDTAAAALRRHFHVSTLDGFGLHGKGEAIRAAAAILAYLQAMQPSALALLTRIHAYTAGEFMTLDESTRRNLELTETIRSGETKGSLLEVLDRTLTPMGGRLLRRWLNQPLLDVAAINHRLDALQYFYDNTAVRLELRELLRQIGDLERWTNRVSQGVALPRDLAGIRTVLHRAPDLLQILSTSTGSPTPALSLSSAWGSNGHAATPNGSVDLLPDLPLCEELLDLLEVAIAEEPPATLANPGIIRRGYSAELDELMERSRHAKDWIANLERTERERLDIKSLKVGYNKVFGYYIEVTHTHSDKVPPEYIRKQTIANAERYITPDLKEYETLVLNADERRLEIEQQLFRKVCSCIAAEADRLLRLADGLARLDVFAGLAEVALTNRYVRPQVDEGPSIEIQDGRHPVVELTLTDEPFVPNDTHLAPDHAIHVLTGPNMAGKCVASDTLLFTARGLSRLVDLKPAEAKLGEFSEIDCTVQGKLAPCLATHFYSGGVQQTVKFSTRLGYHLEGTPEHRVWVRFADGTEGWKRLGELQHGDVIALQRKIDLWGDQTAIDLSTIYELGHRREKRYPLPTELDCELAYVIGLLIGDGTLTYHNSFLLSTADAYIADEFTRILYKHFDYRVGCKANGKDYCVSSSLIRRFLAKLGLTYGQAHEKHIPSAILNAPKRIAIAFLQGLFDTDGYADKRYGNVQLATASLRLAREVQMLLLNLGIIASLHAKSTSHRVCHLVSIYGADAIRFHRTVGFRLPRKQVRSKLASNHRMPNVGGIPYLSSILKQVQHRIVSTQNKSVALKHNKRINSIFYTYIPSGRNITHEKLGQLITYCHENDVPIPELEALQEQYYFYDAVAVLETGETEVYDLSVEGDHAYIANGFVSHNSTYLRQVALNTLMAQIGSFVPAASAHIGVVDRIFTRIGASDEIHRGQSTFMVEMVETANILNHASGRSLLVLDEIGRGTSTYDGLAIAWAVIEYIHNHPGLRAKTLFATHYHELTDLAERLPHVVNYNVAVDDSGDGEDVVFLRRIIPGKADRSYGVHVARMAGLPAQVINRAEAILIDLERSGAAGPKRLYEPETKTGKAAALQVSLFADTHPVVDVLRRLDLNNLTPLDALNRLYELQKVARGGSND